MSEAALECGPLPHRQRRQKATRARLEAVKKNGLDSESGRLAPRAVLIGSELQHRDR